MDMFVTLRQLCVIRDDFGGGRYERGTGGSEEREALPSLSRLVRAKKPFCVFEVNMVTYLRRWFGQRARKSLCLWGGVTGCEAHRQERRQKVGVWSNIPERLSSKENIFRSFAMPC